MATNFWQVVDKIKNPFLKKWRKITFHPVGFMYLAHISVPLIGLITSCSISALFRIFGEIDKFKMFAIRQSWRNYHLKRNIYGRIYIPSLKVITFILASMEGGGCNLFMKLFSFIYKCRYIIGFFSSQELLVTIIRNKIIFAYSINKIGSNRH